MKTQVKIFNDISSCLLSELFMTSFIQVFPRAKMSHFNNSR